MIYVFLAQGFEEIEAITCIDLLRRVEELEVQVVGVGGLQIKGAHGLTVIADITTEQAVPNNLEMVVLPGGLPGAIHLEADETVREFVAFCHATNKPIAAICAAPVLLGHMGLLDGKNATCFPGFESQLGTAVYTGKAVEWDGNIITGKGPGASLPFALKLVEYLQGEERAELLSQSLMSR